MAEEPSRARRRGQGVWLAAAAVLLVLVGGCQTRPASPAPAPCAVPALPAVRESAGVREAMADVAAPVRVLLFAWFAERFADTPSCADSVRLAQAERRRAAQQVALDVRRSWIERSGGLLATAGDDGIAISRATVAAQHALPDFAARLAALRELLAAENRAEADLADCLADRLWPEPARAHREEFAAWHARIGGRRVLPPPPGTDGVRRELGELATAAGVREAVLERLLQAEELERRRKFAEALRQVEEIAADAGASQALELLGDVEIRARIEEKRRFLPQTTVSAECEHLRRYQRLPLATAAASLAQGERQALQEVRRLTDALERRLSQRLTQWQADPRFQPALERYGNEIEDLAKAACAGRLAAWEAELRGLPPPLRPWEQHERLAPWLASLRDYSGPGGVAYRFLDTRTVRDNPLARTALQEAAERLLPIYAASLPEAFADWRGFAERQVTLHLRHGVALAVAERMLEMVAVFPPEAVPASVQEHVAWARGRIASSLERFLAKEAACAIRIEPLESATPGLGATWARDLETRLRDALARTGHQTFARVVPVGGEASEAPRSLRIARGRIASFSADETTETASIREVQEVGEPRLTEEPTGRTRYEQQICRRAIHVLTTERVAHVRVQFQIEADGKAEDVEVNRFFRKQFVQESSHPFLDLAVLEIRRAEQRAGLAPASAPLELRSERTWTASEMLDWVRQAALDEMAERICHRLAAYPLRLAESARAAAERENWLAATDAWGYAAAYLSRLRLPETAAELPKETLDRRAEVAAWRDQAGPSLRAALLRALRERPSKEEAP